MCPETFNLWVVAERVQSRHQQQFSINVWAMTVGECLVGPHIMSQRLTGNYNWDFLLHDLPKLLEHVPLPVRARMWYIHDGAPAHFSRAVRDVLSNTYYDRWIGRGGPIALPPRSPDLNHLDFYLWGHLKTIAYAAPVDKEEALHNHIVDACQIIRNFPGIFERMRWSWSGVWRHALNILKDISRTYYIYCFSYKSQIKCFRAYYDMDICSCFHMWNSCPKSVRTFQSQLLYADSLLDMLKKTISVHLNELNVLRSERHNQLHTATPSLRTSLSTNQWIATPSRNRNFHYCDKMFQSMIHIMAKMNHVIICQPYFSKNHFLYELCIPTQIFFQLFRPKFCIHCSSLPYIPHQVHRF
jgi:hypothetical protein